MKRILSLILCVLMLISAVPMMAVSADEPTAKEFDDVKPGKWYYEGVMWCYENGYMTGESETIFAPSKDMTRAMLVTVLAAIAGVDTSADEYQQSPFVDVAAGKWYTGAVVWANQNDIANGISDDTFGYKNPVTREQLVVMVYQFMQMQGVDVSKVNENKYNACGDTDRVHSWAVEAMKWAVDNEIVSGTGTIDGAPQISPRDTATRAQIAVIVKAMLGKNLGGEHPVGSLTLGGADISEFAIVYGETHDYKKSATALTIAEYLRDHIAEATGVTLEIYSHTDREAVEGAKEILIGRTNREDAGFVTVDREGFELEDLVYEMQGNYLILASNEKYSGTYLAANRFLEDVLGFTNFTNDIYGYTSLASASIEDGTRVVASQHMEHFRSLQIGADNPFISPSEGSLTFCNPVHHIPMLACDGCDVSDDPLSYSHHVSHHMESDPCLSDSDTLDIIVKNVGIYLEKKNEEYKGAPFLFWFSQGDGEDYCKCENCAAIYRVWGRCATYVIALNHIADIYGEKYPNVQFVGVAYKYTIIPPKSVDEIDDKKYNEFIESYTERYVPMKDLSSNGRTIIMACTDTSCFSHAFNDPNCKNKSNSNVRFNERLLGWEKLFPKLYTWDYVYCDTFRHNPLPNIYEMWQNYSYYSEHGLKGICVQGADIDYADFAVLHTYLAAMLAREGTMTEAEFNDVVNGCLKAQYGSGWTYLREYIDQLEKLSSENEWHVWWKNSWNDILTEQQWADNIEYFNTLLDKALAYADTDAQKTEVLKVMTQLRFIEACLAYSKYASSELPADLEAYQVVNQAYADHIASIGDSSYQLPDNWSISKDPGEWEW